MKRCRLCQSSDVEALPFALPEAAGPWWRCKACGSDTSGDNYDPSIYANLEQYRSAYLISDQEGLKNDCRTNCDWFDEHARVKEGRSFLDIGSGPGAALDAMLDRGWEPHGFEVSPVRNSPHPMVIAPVFNRWHWPKPFAAVLAREVFEHIDGPENFLHECHGVTMPGGLFQIQTPKPIDYWFGANNGRGHLFLASVPQLKKMLAEAMFDIIGSLEWATGQAHLARARGA